MSDRAAGKRKRSDDDAQALVQGINNLQIPRNDDEMEMEAVEEMEIEVDEEMEMDVDEEELDLITDAKSGPANNTKDGAEAENTTHNQDVLNPRGANVLIRICFNNKYASAPFAVPAHHAQRMWQVLEIAQEKMPWLNFENTLDGSGLKVLAEPLFLLQETSFNTYLMRCSPWITTLNNSGGTPYLHWYRRNIQRGEEAVLKIEVRLRTDGKVENYDLFRRAGNGELSLNNRGYHPLNIEHNDFVEIWELLSNNMGDQTGVLHPRTEPGTATFFPERRHRRNTVDQQGNVPEAMSVAVPQEGSPAPPPGPEDAWMPGENMVFDDQWKAALDEGNFTV